MITVYGIQNCDTCAKARRWLNDEGIAHRFHDVRRDGLDPATVHAWSAALGWDSLINRRGATWRNLPDSDKNCFADQAIDAAAPTKLVLANPTLVKRPVFDLDGAISVGFKEAEKKSILSRMDRV